VAPLKTPAYTFQPSGYIFATPSFATPSFATPSFATPSFATPGFIAPAVTEPAGDELATVAFLVVLRELISDFFLIVTMRSSLMLNF
jgi:hypothetical protein